MGKTEEHDISFTLKSNELKDNSLAPLKEIYLYPCWLALFECLETDGTLDPDKDIKITITAQYTE